MNRVLFILLLIMFSGCKNKLPNNVQNALISVLSENQSIQEKLLKSLNPDLSPLKKSMEISIQEAKAIPDLETRLKKLNDEIPLKSLNIDETYSILSKFSEGFSIILTENQVKSEYNQFYCPMVTKYWIAKGTEIQNPYAADMRDCGELVK